MVKVYTALVTELEVLAERELFLGVAIYLVSYILLSEEFFCATADTAEAVWTFPLAVWNGHKRRCQALIVRYLVADGAH